MLALVTWTPLLLCGCEAGTADLSADAPELQRFVRLVLPRRIEIQRYLTKPVQLDTGDDRDGIEVILQALDSFGDPVKCVGTFHFELREQRFASSDRLGRRIGFWKQTLDSDESIVMYWDRLSRFYRFPLQLRDTDLAPGAYVVTATLTTPTGDKLYDEYVFTHNAEPGTPAEQP